MEDSIEIKDEVVEEEVKPFVACEICGKPFDTERQLIGHSPHCKRKQAGEATEREVERQKSLADFEKEIEADDTAEFTEPVSRGREEVKRIPFGVREAKLHVPEREGYRRRVFNDKWAKEPGRIERAKRAGYRIVEDSPLNGTAVGGNKDGSPIQAMVMEIPQEWFDEDQKAKADRIDQTERLMNKGDLDQTEPAANRYVPKGMTNTTVYTN